MRGIISIAMLPAFFAAAGCSTSMPINDADAPRTQIESTLTSEMAYRRIVTAARTCYPLANPKVNADYFPEAKAGTVSISMGNVYIDVQMTKISIATAPRGSVVDLTYRKNMPEFGPAVGRWLDGDEGPCPYR